MLRAAGTGCQEPALTARSIETVAGDAVEPNVTPSPLRVRGPPRSTTTLPVHCVAHHAVLALPSTAFAAGVLAAAELALVPAPMAMSTARDGCGAVSAAVACAEP